MAGRVYLQWPTRSPHSHSDRARRVRSGRSALQPSQKPWQDREPTQEFFWPSTCARNCASSPVVTISRCAAFHSSSAVSAHSSWLQTIAMQVADRQHARLASCVPTVLRTPSCRSWAHGEQTALRVRASRSTAPEISRPLQQTTSPLRIASCTASAMVNGPILPKCKYGETGWSRASPDGCVSRRIRPGRA